MEGVGFGITLGLSQQRENMPGEQGWQCNSMGKENEWLAIHRSYRS